MSKIFAILRPLLWIALLVGKARFTLSLVHAPRALVYLASLTAVELLGMLYLAYRVAVDRELGDLQLWSGNLILFGVCQMLYVAGLVYTYLSGMPTLFHEVARLRDFWDTRHPLLTTFGCTF